MIDQNFFSGEAGKLIQQFGDKNMSGHKLGLIYKAIRKLDPVELVSIIDDFIGNSKFAPTLDDFRDKSRGYLISKAKENTVDCKYCHGSGQIVVRKITGEVGEYGFACTCVNGSRFPALPPFRDSYKKEFTMQVISRALTENFHGLNKKKVDFDKNPSDENFARELNLLMKKYIV